MALAAVLYLVLNALTAVKYNYIYQPQCNTVTWLLVVCWMHPLSAMLEIKKQKW